MSDLQNLIEMGFSEEKCIKALSLNNQNMQQALDWLLIHGNELDEPAVKDEHPNQVLKLSSATSSDEKVNPVENQDDASNPNSLKCDDCGLLLKDEDFATLHAHKTGHVNFSQSTESIKPKTKEEIEEQKIRLSEKLKKLRQEREEKEKQEQLEKEKLRRKEGRQLNEIKQKFQEEEMKRIAELKRKEKLADAEYKRKLKEQIARDREAFRKESQPEQSKQSPQSQVQPVSLVVKKDYNECRIQIRLTDGSTMIQKFNAQDQLSAVRSWVEENRNDSHGAFNLMQTFPKKIYTSEDMSKTLTELGLVPASSLVVTKP